MDFHVNIDRGYGGKTGVIHARGCSQANPVIKADPTGFWFGTLSIDAAQRIVADLEAEENVHSLCVDRETLQPRRKA